MTFQNIHRRTNAMGRTQSEHMHLLLNVRVLFSTANASFSRFDEMRLYIRTFLYSLTVLY